MIEDAIANAGPRARDAFATMCEVAQRFAGWLDLGSGIQAGARVRLRALGRTGIPGRRAATRSRCRCVSCTWRGTSPSSSPPPAPTRHGPSSSVERVPRTTRGSPSSPCANFDDLLAELDEARMWEQALESEPFPQVWIAGERVDAAFTAIAALTGLKSPWLREHSTGVAELAEAAAWRMGLPADCRHAAAPRRARARPRPGRRVERDLGEAGAARVRRMGAGATPSALHRARLRSVAGARPDRDAGRLAPRAARRLRLPPRHARAGARSGGPHPRRRRLLRGHARGTAVPAGARRGGGGGGAAARGRRGAARPGRRRRGARRRRPPRAAATCASSRPA